jgi:uncharacterized protein (DUF2249 family)
MNENLVTLDVREDIRQGRSPFSRIMSAATELKRDQTLRILAPFEPVPLYAVLSAEGFSHQSLATDSGEWDVRFSRVEPASAAPVESVNSPVAAQPCGCAAGEVLEVDARGLEPPQPLVTILEALGSVPEGGQLRARTDRRPMHLYAQLEQRGFTGQTEEQVDGSFLTVVQRR